MALKEHLEELRRRLIISMVAIGIGAIIGFIWYQNAPFGMMSLGEIIRRPYCNLPQDLRVSFGENEECRLLATSPFEMFMLRLKVGALAGLVLSSPIWLSQIWFFITPGLVRKEKRYTFIFVALAVTLFVAGALLAYFILDVGLEFLLSMGDQFQTAWLTGDKYYSFVLGLTVIFGVSFEVPLIIIMLNIIGVLEYEHVKGKRRIIIVVIFIFAAFMTPGQDPYSMVILAIAINILVEMAFQFCRINDKRRAKSRPDWMDLDDDASSALGDEEKPGGISAPQPVERATPISTTPASNPPITTAKKDLPSSDYFDDVL
ncbi:twin-arginine translocase subunit TatC [Corynebacterium sp. S7]